IPDSRVENSSGKYFIIDSGSNHSVILANRLIKNKISAGFVDRAITARGRTFRAGSLVIDKARIDQSRLSSLARGLGLTIESLDSVEPARINPLSPYRLAIYQPWTASLDEGWTRWVLEQFEFQFRVIHNSEIKAGQLEKNFSHLILPNISAGVILEGRKKGEVPPEYAGGIGAEGLTALNSFINNGGVLIAMENSADFAIQSLGLPVKNIIEPRRLSRNESEPVASSQIDRVKIYSPGSILRVQVDNSRPEAFGFDQEAAIFSYFSPVFELGKIEGNDKLSGVEKIWNIAWYPAYEPLLSGILLNGDKLKNKSAAVVCQVGKGRVILLGLDVIHRAQAYGSFRFLFNPILYR
ncbi:MAG: hypothetical protein ACPLRA_01430, partial [Candidatus Saccharicenans sp.]